MAAIRRQMALPESFSLVADGETPERESWCLLPLYKTGKVGHRRVWQVGFDGRSLVTASGVVGGKIRRMFTQVTTNASGRTIQQQALQEARDRYRRQYRNRGYRPTGENTPTVPLAAVGLADGDPEPMLARVWIGPATEPPKPGGCSIKFWPVACQRKLDGIRNLARREGSVIFRSRHNRTRATLASLRAVLEHLFDHLPAVELDGELYVEGANLYEIASIVKREKNVSVDEDRVVYHIFDYRPLAPEADVPFEERHALLVASVAKCETKGRFSVLPYDTAHDEAAIVRLHASYRAAGYEGTIVRYLAGKSPPNARHALSLYKCGRCANLLKHKDALDDEGEIVGVEAARGTEEGAAVLVVRDKAGRTFGLRMSGSIEERRRMYNARDSLIGKMVTYRYQELGSKGAPRNPVGIAIRDYE